MFSKPKIKKDTITLTEIKTPENNINKVKSYHKGFDIFLN